MDSAASVDEYIPFALSMLRKGFWSDGGEEGVRGLPLIYALKICPADSALKFRRICIYAVCDRGRILVI
ncbi:hypothetical protein P691DRAFT_809697, partial [Macrolepiota fuliginosa MF-IS2]